MLEYLIFTCPECGSHELRRVEHARMHFIDRSVIRKEGKYLPGNAELIENEPRGLAGLQCAKCMYPDANRNNFRWKTWKYLEAHGCLSPDPDRGKEKVACTVCSLDGLFYRTHVLLGPREQLSKEARQRILEQVLRGKPGVVLCGRDHLLDAPLEAAEGRKSRP